MQDATIWTCLDGDNGTLSSVSCLLGLTINDISKASVIHKPFLVDSGGDEGVTFFNTAEHGCFQLKTSTKMSP